MPLPEKNKDEKSKDFISRCMSSDKMQKEFPDGGQRMAVCLKQSGATAMESADLSYYFETFGFTEDVTEDNLYIPTKEEYIDVGEASEDTAIGGFKYKDIKTGEIYEFVRQGVYKKDGRTLVPILASEAAEYQGRKVTLNKPFRTSDGPKKFAVYTKNGSGKVVIVRFGDPNMEIKRDNPKRRKSFRARHKCDTDPGPKWKARYWSCKNW